MNGKKTITAQASAMGWTNELSSDNALYREFTFNTDGSVSFGPGVYYGIGGYSGYGQSSAIMIPMYIIGYKLGI